MSVVEGQRQKVVGEPGVLGQHRAVEVGRDHSSGLDPLAAVLAVVAEAQEHPAEGSRRAEERAAAVVFEADQQARLRTTAAVFGAGHTAAAGVGARGDDLAGLPAEFAYLGHDVADQAPLAAFRGEGLEVEQAQASQLAAVGGHVAPAQELQPGAHREHHAAVVDHRGKPGPQAGKIDGGGVLHAILAAAHEDQIALGRRLVAELERVPVHGEAAQSAAPREGGHVAAVAVGVHRRRVEVDGLDADAGRLVCRGAHWRTTCQPARALRTSLSAV